MRALLARESREGESKWTRNQLWKAIDLLAEHHATNTTKMAEADSGNARAVTKTDSSDSNPNSNGNPNRVHSNIGGSNSNTNGSSPTSKTTGSPSFSAGGGVPYDVFLWNVLKGDELVFRQMLVSQLITVDFEDGSGPAGAKSASASSSTTFQHHQHHDSESTSTGNGGRDDDRTNKQLRRRVVKAGSPLFQEVYQRLHSDDGLRAVYGREVMLEEIAKCEKRLDNYERDLVRLQEVDDVKREKYRDLSDPNKTLQARKRFLLDLIQEEHDKLEKFHAKRREFQKTLKERQNVKAAK